MLRTSVIPPSRCAVAHSALCSSIFRITLLIAASGSNADAQVPCPNTQGACTTPSDCGQCEPATVSYTTEIEKRGLGPLYPSLYLPRFDHSLGTLRRVEFEVTVRPGCALVIGESTSARPCSFTNDVGSTVYEAIIQSFSIRPVGQLNDLLTLNPRLPTLSMNGMEETDRLAWGVKGSLAALSLPAFDGCLDFALPPGTRVPAVGGSGDGLGIPVSIATCPGNEADPLAGGPDGMMDGGALPAGCPSDGTTIYSLSGGVRFRAGMVSGIPQNVTESGFADYRIFDEGDAYRCTVCYSDPTCIGLFQNDDDCCEGDSIEYDVSALAGIDLPSTQLCSGILMRAEVTAGIVLTVTYVYCPAPPDAVDDCGDVCRSVGSQTFIDALANDRATTAVDSCTAPTNECQQEVLDCALLTDSYGITNGAYGTATWVSAGCPANPLSPCADMPRCIRYRLDRLPPANCVYDTFTYTITNGSGCSDVASVRVLIASPDAIDDPLIELCDEPGVAEVLIPVLCNDGVCSQGGLGECPARTLDCGYLTGSNGISGVASYATATWVDSPPCPPGQADLCSPNRCILYRLTASPPAGQRIDEFTYTIRDSNGCVDTALASVRIAAPIPVDDEAVVCAQVGQSVRINVLCNDDSKRPIRCELLTARDGLTDPTYGIATWVTGSDCGVNDLCASPYRCIEYVVDSPLPGALDSAVDTFTYTLVDEFGCRRTGSVRVTLCRLEAFDDVGEVCQGDSAQVCILENDRYGCGVLDCGSVSLLGVIPPEAGFASLSPSCARTPTTCGETLAVCSSCCLVFTPAPGFVGLATVRYRLRGAAADLPGTPCESESYECLDEAEVRICVAPTPIARDDDVLVDSSNPGPYHVDVLANDNFGMGCELCCDPMACHFLDGSLEIVQQGAFATGVVHDGHIDVTLQPGFTSYAEIRYRIRNQCLCCSEARIRIGECITYNRQLPGSLVVFPDFDNRQPSITMLTLTNTNCSLADVGTFVRVVYIDRTDCGESDFTFQLSQCDTVSWLTSAHNPNTDRGYAYAYASDAQGRAISFNHLIGHQFQVNGFEDVSYTVNPWIFRSPLPERALTDLDGDGIRDLDGGEYDPPPRELLVPRFLGQDPSPLPGYRSELVLINLAGGAAFTTIVEFDIYNDSEDKFSAQYAFYCWDRIPLRNISGAFLNSFLQTTQHDPDEILGAATGESGWFRLRGLSASSGIEKITQPSVLGHLIEIVGTLEVADLPYELCPAGNGDLLPTGPFGDGPLHLPDDNQ
jgi:hypothetical protein